MSFNRDVIAVEYALGFVAANLARRVRVNTSLEQIAHSAAAQVMESPAYVLEQKGRMKLKTLFPAAWE